MAAKKRKRKSTPTQRKTTPPPAPRRELPTAAQLAKGTYTEYNKQYYNTVQVALDYYLNMNPGGINKTQYDAGETMHKIFATTGILIPTTPCYETVTLGAQGDSVTERQVIARQQYRRALKAVHGHTAQALIENVCCYGYLLKDIPVPGYPRPNERMARFREALNDLIRFFGLPINPRDEKYFYEELKWR